MRTCPEVAPYCPDDPLGNYSSEADDSLDYISTQYAGNPPPLLKDWTAISCGKTVISRVSQLDADMQAKAAAELCLINGECPGCQIFFNSPQTCCVPCPDGSLSCLTIPGGVFPGLTQFDANTMAYSFACVEAFLNRACFTVQGPSEVCLGSAYSASLNSIGPVTWSLKAGSLPPGLAISTTSQVLTISGMATTAGQFNFLIRATSSVGVYSERPLSICIVSIVPPSPLSGGTIGVAYSQTLVAPSCTISHVKWSISAGALPAGLTLNADTGEIIGTPTTAGTYNFTVQLKDGQ